MKTTVMSIVLGLMGFSVIAHAGQDSSVSSVVSNDGKVVIAVQPYVTKEEMKRIGFSAKKYVPIGIYIQNYSKNEVIAGWPQVVKEGGTKGERIPYISPYRDRMLGVMVNNDFYTNAENLNKQLHDQHAPQLSLPILTIGELYSRSKLGSMEAIFGLVFLKVADHQVDPNATVLEVPFSYNQSDNGFVARFSLRDGNAVIAATDKSYSEKRKITETLNKISDGLARRESSYLKGVDADPSNYPVAVSNKVKSNLLIEAITNCKKQPNTKFFVRVDEGMNVLSAKPEDSNIDVICSEGVIRAIQKSSPFPMPPKSLYKEAVAEGFVFEMVPKTKIE